MNLTSVQLLARIRQQIREVTAAEVHATLQSGRQLRLIDYQEFCGLPGAPDTAPGFARPERR